MYINHWSLITRPSSNKYQKVCKKSEKKYAKNLEIQIFCVPLHPRSRKTHKTEQIGAVVQLVRISACHAGGRGFESRPHRKKRQVLLNVEVYFCREQGRQALKEGVTLW